MEYDKTKWYCLWNSAKNCGNLRGGGGQSSGRGQGGKGWGTSNGGSGVDNFCQILKFGLHKAQNILKGSPVGDTWAKLIIVMKFLLGAI